MLPRIEYTIALTDDHVVEMYAEHRRQQKALLWLALPLKFICALGLLALFAVGVWAKVYPVCGFAAFFLLLLALGPRVDYWVMRRRWRQNPQFNEVLRIEVSESGLASSTPSASATAQWSAYTHAVFRPTGVLLYSTKWQFYWLPDKAITAGSAAGIRELLRARLPTPDAK